MSPTVFHTLQPPTPTSSAEQLVSCGSGLEDNNLRLLWGPNCHPWSSFSCPPCLSRCTAFSTPQQGTLCCLARGLIAFPGK